VTPVPETEQWITSRRAAVRLVALDGAGDPTATLVLAHGMVTSTDVLRQARPGVDPYRMLARAGLNVRAVDLPGHGRSGGRRGHLTWRAALDALHDAVGAATDRWDTPVALGGTALGGALAAYAALSDDRVAAVVAHTLIDLRDIRPLLQRFRQKALLPIAGRVLTLLDPEAGRQASRGIVVPAAAVVALSDLAGDPALARTLARHPQAVRVYSLAGLASILLAPDDKPDLAALRQPTLVLAGGGDRVQPVTAIRHVAARLTGPTEVHVIPGAGHQLLIEHHRAVIGRIAEFVQRVCG